MKTKIKLSQVQDELYEKLYPMIVELMAAEGYDKRSPNWWTGGGPHISTHKIKARAFKLAITCDMMEEFEIGMRTYIQNQYI